MKGHAAGIRMMERFVAEEKNVECKCSVRARKEHPKRVTRRLFVCRLLFTLTRQRHTPANFLCYP